MPALDPNRTVGDFVRQRPARARVFETLKIDYCCGGKVSLARACEKRGMDAADVLKKIEADDAANESTDFVDVDAMSLTDLADHIEKTHHAYSRQELTRLDFMTEKVSRVHGDKEPRLHEIRQAFVALKGELEPHMMKEERILFPIIRQLEASSNAPQFHCGSVSNPIRQMEHEHDQAGDALAKIREASDDFVPPEWACNTYRAMLDGLEELETNMHQHVHKENNVLFPRAIRLEQAALT